MDLRLGDHHDGRPSKLTSEIQTAVVEVLAAGGTYAAAAERAGIGLRTLYSWVSKGRRRQKGARYGPYREFAVAVNRATAQAARAAAAERRRREAEELAAQPATPRNTEQQLLHVAKTLRKALHAPLPGDADYAAFEREYSQVRAYLGTTHADADEEDEESAEELRTRWQRIHEHNERSAAILRAAIGQPGRLAYQEAEDDGDGDGFSGRRTPRTPRRRTG
jgi:transposase